MEILGKVRYRSVRAPEPLQNPASGGVRERGERGIQVGLSILNHLVQYNTDRWPASGEVEGYLRILCPVERGDSLLRCALCPRRRFNPEVVHLDVSSLYR